MPAAWKLSLNGATPAPLADFGIASEPRAVVLRLANQEADTLTLRQAGAAFEDDPEFDLGDTVSLYRDEVCVFTGIIREIPREGERGRESLSYVACGPWDWLARRAYLQNFKFATTPGTGGGGGLTTKRIGRVVLGQDDTAARVHVSSEVTNIIGVAILAGLPVCIGALTGLNFFIPWDEATDLSMADAITRALTHIPDAVVWWDYNATPGTPRLHIARRAGMTGVSLALPARREGGTGGTSPIASVSLAPLERLRVSGVRLIYIRQNRDTDELWNEVDVDYAGTGSTGLEDNCLVRTIQLAGYEQTGSWLYQEVNTGTLPTALLGTSGATPAGGMIDEHHNAAGDDDDGDFNTLLTFWRANDPTLRRGDVTVKAFRARRRVPVDDPVSGTPSADCVRYIRAGGGAITDWMISEYGVIGEFQDVTCDVAIERVTPSGKTVRQITTLHARVLATNANTQTYSLLSGASFTPAEEVPTGLAAIIYAALSRLPWEGMVVLDESLTAARAECSLAWGPSKVVNLTGGRAEWEDMAEIVQAASYDLFSARTTLTLGPPRQLSVEDITAVYRANRSRRAVTSAAARDTGRVVTGGGPQGLATMQPSNSSAAHPLAPSLFIATWSIAGSVPVLSDLRAMINTVWPETDATATALRPVEGDQVSFGSYIKVTITRTDPGVAGNVHSFSFTANGETWYAVGGWLRKYP